MTEVKTLTMDSVIQPNTWLYIRMGDYIQYFIKDILTDELVMVIYPDERGPVVRKIEEGITYAQLNPNHKGTVRFMTEGLSPFYNSEFVTTSTGIFRVLLKEGVSYISRNRDKLKKDFFFHLESLATGDSEVFNYNSIHQKRTKEFYIDLYNLHTTGSPEVKAFIKGLIYNKEYAKALSNGKVLKAVEDVEVLKGIFNSTKYGYIATPGGYNYDGSDYHFFTQLSEDGSLVTIKKFFYPLDNEEPCRLVAKQDLTVEDFQRELADITERNLGKSFQEILTLFAEGSGFFFATERAEEKMPTNYIEDL
jgi:hypothetical protein